MSNVLMRGFTFCGVAFGVVIALGGCGPSVARGTLSDVDAGDSSLDLSADPGPGDDGGTDPRCSPSAADLTGCLCDKPGDSRPCYPSSTDPKTRHVGACRDGQQNCIPAGELFVWSACTGSAAPAKELCGDKIDNDCNGLLDCKDPACAVDPSCRSGCVNGQTRPCYDGPPGTQGVGTCKGGMQTCANGLWPMTCPGEVLPGKENCGDGLDHNCNHLAGCLDVFSCALDPKCLPKCELDPGCVCPMTSPDPEQDSCPDGFHGISKGMGFSNPGTFECCPCTANDCGDPECCGEKVCAGNAKCKPFDCKPLPMGCNGRVGFDCDDFPEDCDVLCCKCTQGC